MEGEHVNRSRLLVFVTVMFFCLAASATGQDVADSNKADRDQLTAIVDKWEKAWNSHDMNAFANLFHEDGVRILWTGDVWKGGRAIEEGHAAVHKTVFRNSVQRERIEELTFVGSDAAVIRFFSTLTGDERASRQDDPQPQDLNRDEAERGRGRSDGDRTRGLADATPEDHR